MAAGGALALLALPETPPCAEAFSGVLRVRTAAADATRAAVSTASQTPSPDDQAGLQDLQRLGGAQQTGGGHRQEGLSLGRAAAVAAALSLCLSMLSAWWLIAGTPAP